MGVFSAVLRSRLSVSTMTPLSLVLPCGVLLCACSISPKFIYLLRNINEQKLIEDDYLINTPLLIIVIVYMKVRQTVAKSLSFLGAALSEGQTVKGVERSPEIFRQAGLFDYLRNNYQVRVTDYGNVAVREQDLTRYPPVDFAVRNLNVLGPVLGRLHEQVYNIVQKKQHEFMLTIGGDHSIGAATISGVKRLHDDLRVVWVDAHPDCTDSHSRSPEKMHSENYHGMPLSHLTGITSIPPLPYWKWLTDYPKLDPRNVVLIAIRDIDPDEYINLAKHGVKCFTMDHIDMYGIGEVMKQTIQYLDPENKHPFHLSFDVDGIDPDVVGQTGTRFRYGLTARESIHIVRRLAHERKLVGMDVVEVNELLDPTEEIRRTYRGEGELRRVSKSVGMGMDLISSVFTKYLTL